MKVGLIDKVALNESVSLYPLRTMTRNGVPESVIFQPKRLYRPQTPTAGA
jgi:hypothetical protein